MPMITRRNLVLLFAAACHLLYFKGTAIGLEKFAADKVKILTKRGKIYKFSIEIAVSEQQKIQGLMYRRSLGRMNGMLFDYGLPQVINMWMKNTFIPLDMIFIDENGIIKRIVERTVPHSKAIISSNLKVRAVLEVNSGITSKLRIGIGDKVLHPMFK